jgi:hypothetical protein
MPVTPQRRSQAFWRVSALLVALSTGQSKPVLGHDPLIITVAHGP